MRINPSALRTIRERSGWSVTQFATELGITPGHLSNIEGGRRQPAPAVTVEMAKTLKIPITAILLDPPREKVGS